MQVCAADTKQANSLFDIEIWVVPRFIRPLQSFSVGDFLCAGARKEDCTGVHVRGTQ